jgi:hypothetical protein
MNDSAPCFKEKPWRRAERRGSIKKPRDKQLRSLEEMVRDGEAYSVSSGVQLKFQGDEVGTEEIDWRREFSWSDTEEIVRRYVISDYTIFD